ncbi:MAG: 50S ribosomal protein P1 [Thermoproteota archaeon]|nr:MAG: 50S ribosomal protein P1 [Candidatus Korarchaeota archaeon]
MGLEYVYAALLLHEAGKEISEESLSSVLKAAGLEPDPGLVRRLVDAVSKVDIEEVIKSAAAAPAVPVAAAAPAPTAPAEEKPEEKREEKKEEAEEEAAIAGLASLFG